MTTIDHQHPKVVFEPVLGRWRVEYRTQWTDEWQTHRYHHTLEEAREVAQEMTNNDLDGAYRVVDTQADMTTPRLSGPCTHGHHNYCLGPHMILPCNCDMPRTHRPRTETPSDHHTPSGRSSRESHVRAAPPCHRPHPLGNPLGRCAQSMEAGPTCCCTRRPRSRHALATSRPTPRTRR